MVYSHYNSTTCYLHQANNAPFKCVIAAYSTIMVRGAPKRSVYGKGARPGGSSTHICPGCFILPA